MYDIGVIGGMGSQATATLFDFIVNHTKAETDQQHLNLAILNRADIPDRTEYILGQSEQDPLRPILTCVRELNAIGCRSIILPCNTAHYFIETIQKKSACPVLNMIELTLNYVASAPISHRLCVLATKGTVECGIYERKGHPDLEILYPSPTECDEVQRIIYEVKNTNMADLGRETDNLIAVMKQIQNRIGVCTFCLACTELSVLDKSRMTSDPSLTVVDAMDLLALSAISFSGHSFLLKDLPYDPAILKNMIKGSI